MCRAGPAGLLVVASSGRATSHAHTMRVKPIRQARARARLTATDKLQQSRHLTSSLYLRDLNIATECGTKISSSRLDRSFRRLSVTRTYGFCQTAYAISRLWRWQTCPSMLHLTFGHFGVNLPRMAVWSFDSAAPKKMSPTRSFQPHHS